MAYKVRVPKQLEGSLKKPSEGSDMSGLHVRSSLCAGLVGLFVALTTGCGAADANAPATEVGPDVLLSDAAEDAASGDVLTTDSLVADSLLADGAPDAATGTANIPGKYTHTPTLEGITREFIVYVPAKAKGNVKAPVVFMFHGTSGDGEKFFNISGWREMADAEGLIAVFPSALNYCFYDDEDRDGVFTGKKERAVTTKWAAGKLGDPAVRPLCSAAEIAALAPDKKTLVDHPLKDDVAFVKHVLDFLESSYSIDSKRVYASGFSNGAEMTSRLAVDLAPRFAALAASGSTMSVPPTASRPLTFIWSSGELDPGMSRVFGAAPIPLDASLGSNPAFIKAVVVPYTTTVSIKPTGTHSVVTVAGKKISQFIYKESTAGAANHFRVAIFEGAAHLYPNGTNSPIRLAELLWQLFKVETLP